jgi:Domain of unknown function (DUF6265)
MAFSRRTALVVAVSTLALGGLVARAEVPSMPLSALEFMSGCWKGAAGEGMTIEEYYTRPSANVMLGMTRYLRGDRVTGFEFTSFVSEDTAIVVTPRPEGQQPAEFRITRLAKESAVWENPRHDFPRLISYRRLPGDTLVARIEGPGPQGTQSEEWRMTRTRCDG